MLGKIAVLVQEVLCRVLPASPLENMELRAEVRMLKRQLDTLGRFARGESIADNFAWSPELDDVQAALEIDAAIGAPEPEEPYVPPAGAVYNRWIQDYNGSAMRKVPLEGDFPVRTGELVVCKGWTNPDCTGAYYVESMTLLPFEPTTPRIEGSPSAGIRIIDDG